MSKSIIPVIKLLPTQPLQAMKDVVQLVHAMQLELNLGIKGHEQLPNGVITIRHRGAQLDVDGQKVRGDGFGVWRIYL